MSLPSTVVPQQGTWGSSWLTWSISEHKSIGIDGLNNSILSDLVLRYSPEYYVFLANGSNVVFNNFDISGYSSSSNVAKNTDGWDTYRSTDITIMNSVINNGDGKSTFTPPPLFFYASTFYTEVLDLVARREENSPLHRSPRIGSNVGGSRLTSNP